MFITQAWAAGSGSPSMTDSLISFLPLVVIFFLFWLMIIRPQMKRTKDQNQLIASVQKGDEIITSGGQVGRVVKVSEQFIGLEIATNVVVHVQKSAVQSMLPKGTIKDL